SWRLDWARRRSRSLKKARLEAAKKTYKLLLERLNRLSEAAGAQIFEEMASWSRRWLDCQLELTPRQEDRIAAFEAHVERARVLEKIAKSYFDAGKGPPSCVSAAEFHRLDAEIWLRVNRGMGKKQP